MADEEQTLEQQLGIITLGTQEEVEEVEGPGFLDVTAAGVRVQNVAGSALYGPRGFGDFGPKLSALANYDALDDLEEKYLPYANSFIRSDHPEETAWIKRKIDLEIADRETLHRAGGWGVVASIGAGVLDPINLIPVAGAATKAYQIGKIGAGVSRGVKIGLGVGVITEVPLQLTQETRTWEETALNLAASTVFSGLLSGLGAGLNKAKFNALPDDLKAYFHDEVDPSDILPLDSVGAARVEDVAPGDLDIGGAAVGRLAFKATPKMLSPVVRVLSSFSPKARMVLTRLAEHPFIQKIHEKGKILVHSAELRVRKMTDGFTNSGVTILDDGWKTVRKLFKAENLPSGRKAREEFYQGVTLMLHRLQAKGWVADMMIDELTDPLVKETVRVALRLKTEVFDQIHKEGIAVGRWKKGEIPETNVAQVWKVGVIQENLDEFQTLVGKLIQRWNPKLTEGEAYIYAESIIQRIAGRDRATLPHDLIPEDAFEKAGIREATFNIPEDMITEFEKYLELNIEEILRSYVRAAAGEIEMTRAFGSRNLTDELSEIKNEYAELIKKNPNQAENLTTEMNTVIKDLQYMRDALLGRSQPASSIAQWMLQFNAVRQLGAMTISAFADIGRPIMLHGTRRTVGGIKNLFFNPEIKIAAKEMRDFGVGVELVQNSRFQMMYDGEARGPRAWMNPFSQKMQWLTDKLGRFTGMDHWNAGWKGLGGVISMKRNLEDINLLLAGKLSKKNVTRLARLGIDEEVAGRIAAQLRKKGAKGKYKTISIIDFDVWDDIVAKDAMQLAILKESLEMINTPTVGLMPRWAKESDIWRMFFQYKSFMVASHQQTLIAGLQRNDWNAYSGLMAMVAMGAVAQTIKRGLRFAAVDQAGSRVFNWDKAMEEWNDNPTAALIGAIDQSGALSFPMEGANMIDKITNGMIFSAVDDDRYYSRTKMEAVGGPWLGVGENILRTAGGLAGAVTGYDDWTEADTRRVRKLLPYQNLFYIRWLFDAAEDGINQATGAE